MHTSNVRDIAAGHPGEQPDGGLPVTHLQIVVPDLGDERRHDPLQREAAAEGWVMDVPPDDFLEIDEACPDGVQRLDQIGEAVRPARRSTMTEYARLSRCSRLALKLDVTSMAFQPCRCRRRIGTAAM